MYDSVRLEATGIQVPSSGVVFHDDGIVPDLGAHLEKLATKYKTRIECGPRTAGMCFVHKGFLGTHVHIVGQDQYNPDMNLFVMAHEEGHALLAFHLGLDALSFELRKQFGNIPDLSRVREMEIIGDAAGILAMHNHRRPFGSVEERFGNASYRTAKALLLSGPQ